MVQTILPLLNTSKNRISKWFSYFGLGIGVVLLLSSMQIFININKQLKQNNPSKSGYDFISISKTITNENMGMDNTFKDEDLNEIKAQPTVSDAAPLLPNKFKVRASAGNVIPFSTDLFLESIDDNFIDTVPQTFKWAPGQETVPVIFASDFLELYNVLALSLELPQLSDKTVSSVNIILEINGASGSQNYKGNIVALSDRINSVLVPRNFMEWANQKFGGVSKAYPSRVYIKTRDANSPQLISFLDSKNYHVNKDKTKFGRIKKVLQNIVSALAVFGILVIILALMLFSFYLQLMIARSRENLQLLLTLGYSPNWLGKTVAGRWIPVYVAVVVGAVAITALLQYGFVKISAVETNGLSYFLHWSVLAVAVLLLALSVFTNFRLVKKELYKIV